MNGFWTTQLQIGLCIFLYFVIGGVLGSIFNAFTAKEKKYESFYDFTKMEPGEVLQNLLIFFFLWPLIAIIYLSGFISAWVFKKINK